jgi:hypothetical protein
MLFAVSANSSTRNRADPCANGGGAASATRAMHRSSLLIWMSCMLAFQAGLLHNLSQ